jgi:hypothetical protein
MKRIVFGKFILSLIMMCFMFAFATSVYADCNVSVSGSVKVVKKGDYIKNDVSGDPKIVIGASSTHKKSAITFYVNFEGANWAGPKSGSLYTGVNYTVEDINRLCIQVNQSSFDFKKRSIVLPVNVKIISGGDITATVESNGTSVSDKTVVFARGVDGNVSFGTNMDGVKANEYCELNPVYINDTTTQIFKAGTKFKVSVDNGYYFTNTGSINATGKFEGKCAFSVDASDKSVGYISITEDTTAKVGKVSVEGLVLKRDATGAIKIIMIEMSGKGIEQYSRSFAAATYDANYVYTPTTTEASTEATTQGPKKTVVLSVNADKYQVNGTNKSAYLPVKIEKMHTVIPLEIFRAVLDVKDEDFSSDGNTAKITVGDKVMTFKVGSSTATLGDESVDLCYDVTSENGNLYVPLVSAFNAVGVEKEDIVFNSADKTITIYIK